MASFNLRVYISLINFNWVYFIELTWVMMMYNNLSFPTLRDSPGSRLSHSLDCTDKTELVGPPPTL